MDFSENQVAIEWQFYLWETVAVNKLSFSTEELGKVYQDPTRAGNNAAFVLHIAIIMFENLN